ncbi:MAG: deoxyribose-phosphate aldolase, partial [Ignavibacteriales bacterium]|nr:deoxyribose-phosphate aldolase [Ignavibacteriales bacterium]
METDLARMIDHTLLKPEATKEQIIQLCNEAKKFHFASVCINPSYVSICAKLLRDTAVKVCTVVGFPLGATSTATKAFETEHALRDGAKEIDMVINVGMLKSGYYDYV